MRKSRRQIVNRLAEATGVAFVTLGLLVFFAVYRPLGNRIEAAARAHSELRQGIRNQQIRVEVLKKFETELPEAGKGLESFEAKRTPERREAYSTAAHLIHKLADSAGVKVSSMGYRLELGHKDDPLERLSLTIDLDGQYSKLLKFAHAMENANEFLLVRDFNFTSGGENQGLTLRLGADLYLKQ